MPLQRLAANVANEHACCGAAVHAGPGCRRGAAHRDTMHHLASLERNPNETPPSMAWIAEGAGPAILSCMRPLRAGDTNGRSRSASQCRHSPACADLPGQNKKRAVRDAKYGFGGRKKLNKQNDADSTADMNAMFKDKRKPGARGKLGVKGGGTKKRPGKDARTAARGGSRR